MRTTKLPGGGGVPDAAPEELGAPLEPAAADDWPADPDPDPEPDGFGFGVVPQVNTGALR
jgi:hypothetical protein